MNDKPSSHTYYESLPKKRMGAGCLLFDLDNRVLLVKPNYKPGWEIPGGVVEHNESPKQCCQRELLEEIGLKRTIGRLLVIEYTSTSQPKPESLMFIFDGGTLTESEISAIKLQKNELSEFAFFTPDFLPDTMTKPLKNRVLAAWQQREKKGSLYLENQQIAR